MLIFPVLLVLSFASATDQCKATDSNWSDEKCAQKCNTVESSKQCPPACADHCRGCICPLVNAKATCQTGCGMWFDGCNDCTCQSGGTMMCTGKICSESQRTDPFCKVAGDTSNKIIYGEDDRKDYYEWVAQNGENHIFSRYMRESIVALMDKNDLGNPTNGVYENILGTTLQSGMGTCSSERFSEQRIPAFCSGTLVDANHIVTAGHCITNQNDCNDVRFVFKHYVTGYDGSTPIYETITTDEVYSCESYERQQSGFFSPVNLDWAYVKLDRTVDATKRPVNVEREAIIRPQNSPTVMIGCPSGLPFKIDDGGRVTDPGNANNLDYFTATTDSYGGNSGSGVFNEDGSKMVGILVRGQLDYTFRFQGFCFVSNVVSDSSGQEDSTYAHNAMSSAVNSCANTNQCPINFSCVNGACSEETVVCPLSRTADKRHCSGGGETPGGGGECTCQGNWSDLDYNPNCGSQSGCTNCDGDPDGSWCMVIDPTCDTVQPGGWSYCTEPILECIDTDDGASDSWGDFCWEYNENNADAWCGNFDDMDFDSMAMCCACGGGVAPGGPAFMIVDGDDCEIDNNGCVTDGPGNYGNNERCTIQVGASGTLRVEQFDLERNFDFLTIGDDSYTGTNGPDGRSVSLGEQMVFTSDGSFTDPGFVICLNEADSTCVDDDAEMVRIAATAGVTISGCSDVADRCGVLQVQDNCKVTCAQCDDCVDDNAGIVSLAAGQGITISGCSDNIVLNNCATEPVLQESCPVSCGTCS